MQFPWWRFVTDALWCLSGEPLAWDAKSCLVWTGDFRIYVIRYQTA